MRRAHVSSIRQLVQSGTGPTGIAQLEFFNCNSDRRLIHIWVNDVTAQTGWQEIATIGPQWDDGSCPASGTSPTVVSFETGHAYEVAAVDPGNVTCGGLNDPTALGCSRWEASVLGDRNGPTIPVTVA